MAKKNKIKHMSVASWVCFAFLLVYSICLIGILYWVGISSLKHRFDFRENVFGFPSPKWGVYFKNYSNAFRLFRVPVIDKGVPRDVYLLEMLFNSFAYALGCAIAATFCRFFVAYACAKYKFFGSKAIYVIVIVLMIIPLVGSQAAEIKVAITLGLYNSIIAQWFMKYSFLGMYFLVFYGIIKGISQDFWDAASLDGAGHAALLFRIYIPMCSTSIFGICIMQFIGFWNEWGTALYYLPSHPVVAYGLYKIQFSTYTDITIPMKFAACFLSSVPSIVLFIMFRDKFMGNIAMGGLKG